MPLGHHGPCFHRPSKFCSHGFYETLSLASVWNLNRVDQRTPANLQLSLSRRPFYMTFLLLGDFVGEKDRSFVSDWQTINRWPPCLVRVVLNTHPNSSLLVAATTTIVLALSDLLLVGPKNPRKDTHNSLWYHSSSLSCWSLLLPQLHWFHRWTTPWSWRLPPVTITTPRKRSTSNNQICHSWTRKKHHCY